MPVAGFPAPVEALLSSLLSSGDISSWKFSGEPGSTVVVLRFRQRDGQPLLHSHNSKRGTWKRKSPSQQRRDQLRAEEFRDLGRPHTSLDIVSEENPISSVVDLPSVLVDAARDAQDSKSADHNTTSSVTFDLPDKSAAYSATQTEDREGQTTPDPDNGGSCSLASSPSPCREVTVDYIRAALDDIAKMFKENLAQCRETVTEVGGDIAAACTPNRVGDTLRETQIPHRSSPSVPPASADTTEEAHSWDTQAPTTDPVCPRSPRRHRGKVEDDVGRRSRRSERLVSRQ